MSKAAVQAHIKENKVLVFSKTYCPYCTKTKNTLAALHADAKVFELDNMGSEGSDWQAYVGQTFGQTSVPMVFIDGKFIGGNSDLQALQSSGELVKLLA